MGKNIEHTNSTLTMAEKLLGLVRKYSIWEWLKTIFLIIVLGTVAFSIANPDKVIEYFQKAASERHEQMFNQRIENQSEVQRCLDKLLYRYDGTRCVVVELHNGVSTNSGIPFARASVTYESICDSIYPISEQYNGVNLGLVPFASHLYRDGFYQGTSEGIKNIDRSLSFRLQANEISYFTAVSIIGEKGLPIGFLFLTFSKRPQDQDLKDIETALKGSAVRLSVLLELRNR